jgi:hypothetical protein
MAAAMAEESSHLKVARAKERGEGVKVLTSPSRACPMN